jgi:hypothetical protein
MDHQLVALPEPSSLAQDIQEQISRRNRVFYEITADFPVSLGKEVSKDDRDALQSEDNTLTYGELGHI